jgi:hypothetical protein
MNDKVHLEIVATLKGVREDLLRDGQEDAAQRVSEVLSMMYRELDAAGGRPIPPSRWLEYVALVVNILELVKWW